MTLLEKLQAHKGGLIRMKTELYWHDGRGYDNNPGRVCLLLDAAAPRDAVAKATSPAALVVAGISAALLLVDGSPQWIWVAEEDVEVLG